MITGRQCHDDNDNNLKDFGNDDTLRDYGGDDSFYLLTGFHLNERVILQFQC